MRYEAKHHYFKHLSSVIGTSKNICHSLLLRHQLHQWYMNLDRSNLPGEEVETGPGMLIICSLLQNN